MTEIPASQVLRDATRNLHSRIEATPFAQSLLDQTIQLDAYVGYIRVLAVIHATLESRLDACDDSMVSEVWSDDLRRLPELLEDNDTFRWRLVPEAPQSVQAAQRIASHILLVSKENPIALLGAMYVLGGSTKGAVILAPLAKHALGLSAGRGLSYLTRHSGEGPAEWDRAARILDDSVTDPVQVQSIVETALVVFQGLLDAFEALCPLNQAIMRHVVTAFNPEAGNHPVPQDHRDLIAVLRASERCLAEFPYFVYRFGQRGHRFADTDGAWLTTLPELGAEGMQTQVAWLGKLLSARGMPRVLLARHMEILGEELVTARPDQAERSSLLESAARIILDELDAYLPKPLRQEHVRKLQLTCGRSNDFACSEAILLLASAVLDESTGVVGSTQSLLSWLCDPSRFPRPWVESIEGSLTDLREKIQICPGFDSACKSLETRPATIQTLADHW